MDYHNFFFQAEDGIRDWSVTGVQTCALPIYSPEHLAEVPIALGLQGDRHLGQMLGRIDGRLVVDDQPLVGGIEIGRASCRERVWGAVVAEGCKCRMTVGLLYMVDVLLWVCAD